MFNKSISFILFMFSFLSPLLAENNQNQFSNHQQKKQQMEELRKNIEERVKKAQAVQHQK